MLGRDLTDTHLSLSQSPSLSQEEDLEKSIIGMSMAQIINYQLMRVMSHPQW